MKVKKSIRKIAGKSEYKIKLVFFKDSGNHEITLISKDARKSVANGIASMYIRNHTQKAKKVDIEEKNY